MVGIGIVNPNSYKMKDSPFILSEIPRKRTPKAVQDVLDKLPRVVIEENPPKKLPKGSTVCYMA